MLPPLHVVTDDAVLQDASFLARASEALEAGGPRIALHLRGPWTTGALLYRFARDLLPAVRRGGGWLLVNDRVDVAMAAAADGVQLGRRSLRLPEARRLLGPARCIGASVHSNGEARAAAAQGADFLMAGTLFPSASHPARPGAGLGWLAGLRPIGLPVVGIGGVTAARVPRVLAAGAAGVAVLGAVWRAGSPGAAVIDLVHAIRDHNE